MAGGGRDHDAVARGVGRDRGLQDARALGERDDLLAGLVAAAQRLERGQEAVTMRRRHHEARGVFADRDGVEARARRRREAAGERLAVAARGRQRVGGRRVRAAGGIEEDGLLVGAPARGAEQRIALAIRQRGGVDVMALRGAHPALVGQHDGDGLGRHEIGLGERRGRLTRHERRAARVAVLLGVVADLVLHERAQALLRAQRHVQARTLFLELVLFAADLHLLEAGELAQLRVEDVVGLDLGEPEARDELRLRFLLGADDADHLVEVEVRDAQAIEQVQPLLDLLQPVLQPSPNGVRTEREPLEQQRLQVLQLRAAVEADHVEVHAEALLEVGGREQVAHQRIGVDAR